MRLGSCVKRPTLLQACSALVVHLIFMVALVVFVFKYLLVFVSFFLRVVLLLDVSGFLLQAACVLASVFRVGALDLHCRLGRVRVQVLAGPHDLLLSRAVLYWLCANLRVPGHRHYLRRVRCWSSVLVVAAALEPPASCLDALLALVQAPSWQGWAHAAVRLWGFFFSAPLALHMPSFDHVPASRTWFLACCSCKSPS